MSEHEVKLTDREFALAGAAQAFCNRGITIACPWEGDLDDEERERFDALVAAIDSYNALITLPDAPVSGSGETVLREALEIARHYLLDLGGAPKDKYAADDLEIIDAALAASPTPPETQAVEVGK